MYKWVSIILVALAIVAVGSNVKAEPLASDAVDVSVLPIAPNTGAGWNENKVTGWTPLSAYVARYQTGSGSYYPFSVSLQGSLKGPRGTGSVKIAEVQPVPNTSVQNSCWRSFAAPAWRSDTNEWDVIYLNLAPADAQGNVDIYLPAEVLSDMPSNATLYVQLSNISFVHDYFAPLCNY